MLHGYVKLHRQILDWEWYTDSNTKDVFLHLLLKASFKDTSWRGIPINAGQVIIGQKQLAEELGLTASKVRTALNHLESTHEISIKTTNKFSIVTIEKWNLYQSDALEIASKLPTNRKQIASKSPHRKNVKNVKNDKKLYGEFSNVSLSDDELNKLQSLFPDDWKDRIEDLSSYMASSGKEYENHYAAVKRWSRKEYHEKNNTYSVSRTRDNRKSECKNYENGQGLRIIG